jgi:hypothetical protein
MLYWNDALIGSNAKHRIHVLRNLYSLVSAASAGSGRQRVTLQRHHQQFAGSVQPLQALERKASASGIA